MKLPALQDEEITNRNQEENTEINHIQINKEIDAIQRVRDSQVEVISEQDTNQSINGLQENCLHMNRDIINSTLRACVLHSLQSQRVILTIRGIQIL